MDQFNINEQVVNVDVHKTKELYKELPLISDKGHCGCSDCTSYTKAIVQASSSVLQFFERLGIDPRKEAEVWRVCDNDDGTVYFVADYHFIGEIQKVPELDWIVIDEASFGLTNRTDNLPSPMIPCTFTGPIIEMIVKINLYLDK